MENSFKIKGHTYKVGKIPPLKQFHIVRRIGPLLFELMSGLSKMKDVGGQKLSQEEQLDILAKASIPFMEGLSKLSDADSDYVLFRLLAVIEAEQPEFKTWRKIATDEAIIDSDLELSILIQCAYRALMFNCAGFFSLLPQKT